MTIKPTAMKTTHRKANVHPVLQKRKFTNTEAAFNNLDVIGNKTRARWPWEAEIQFCHRCVQLINFGRIKRDQIKLEQLELDDLRKQLFRITGIEFKDHSLQYKWDKLRLNNDGTKNFNNMDEDTRAEYYGARKTLFPDASHLNVEKIDESDNNINWDGLAEDRTNDFEPHGVTQSYPSSNIAYFAHNSPTMQSAGEPSIDTDEGSLATSKRSRSPCAGVLVVPRSKKPRTAVRSIQGSETTRSSPRTRSLTTVGDGETGASETALVGKELGGNPELTPNTQDTGSPGPNPLRDFFVRFHYYGSLKQVNENLDYIGELLVAEIPIPINNLSYAELRNYAEDIHRVKRGHCRGTYMYTLYWLVPGGKLSDGFIVLTDDELGKRMDNGITYGGYADIFVEVDMTFQQEHFDSDNDKEMHQDQTMLPEIYDAGLFSVKERETYSRQRGEKVASYCHSSVQIVDTKVVDEILLQKMASATESAQVSASESAQTEREVAATTTEIEREVAATVGADHEIATEHVQEREAPPVEKSDEEDGEYEPILDCSSGEDSEAEELIKLATKGELLRTNQAVEQGAGSGSLPSQEENMPTLPINHQETQVDDIVTCGQNNAQNEAAKERESTLATKLKDKPTEAERLIDMAETSTTELMRLLHVYFPEISLCEIAGGLQRSATQPSG